MKSIVWLIFIEIALSAIINPTPLVNRTCQQLYGLSQCPKPDAATPVCGYAGFFPSRLNFSSGCLACNDQSNPALYYTTGACSAPAPPPFAECKQHAGLISKCDLLSEVFNTEICLVDLQGSSRTINSTSPCTDLCSDPNTLKYVEVGCDYVHEGKTIAEWATLTKPKLPPSIPLNKLAGGYTKCPEKRPQLCTKSTKKVCGAISEDSQAEFDSECLACLNSSVKGWKEGTCDKIVAPDFRVCESNPESAKSPPTDAPKSTDDSCRICTLDSNLANIQTEPCGGDPCSNDVLLYAQQSCNAIQSELPIWMWLQKFAREQLIAHYENKND